MSILQSDITTDIYVPEQVVSGNEPCKSPCSCADFGQLLRRPREYIQLHRDTTVNQLMFTTVLSRGTLEYTDSPLLRAITHGRVMVVDEADKAAEHVVAIFRGLAGHGQLTLADGRRVCKVKERESDLVVHPDFRLILLANRPGYRESSSLRPGIVLTVQQHSWATISCRCSATTSVVMR